MRDVAALAGVSLKTVSRVVNREAGRLAATSRERVERAVDQLGYRPQPGREQPAARPRPHRHRRRPAPGRQQHVLRQPAAQPRGRRPRPRRAPSSPPASTRSPSASGRSSTTSCAAGSTACVLMPASRAPGLPRRRAAQRPARRSSSTARPHGVDADSVTVDNRAVARGWRSSTSSPRATARIALPRRPADHPDRRRPAARLPRRPTPRPGSARPAARGHPGCVVRGGGASGGRRACSALADPPTAVFAARNSLAIGAVAALRAARPAHARSRWSGSTTSRWPTSSTRR